MINRGDDPKSEYMINVFSLKSAMNLPFQRRMNYVIQITSVNKIIIIQNPSHLINLIAIIH